MADEPDTDYEYIEVKVSQKIDIRLSLDDLLTAVQQQAAALSGATQQVPAQVADRLHQLTQLAGELKNDVGQIGQPPRSGSGT